jgi:N-acetylneuraminic acid mutarotase
MKDGRVLVVGGCIGNGVCTERVEIFNPQSNAWTEAMPLESDRASHTAHLLSDGRVLVAGGWGVENVPVGGDALLYNPQTNLWTATGSMVKPRVQARSTLLTDGRVLVTGGITQEDQSVPKISASAEIYDPAANAWTATSDLSQERYQHVLVLLADDQVLAVGGARNYENRWTGSSFVREIERFDPVTGHWSSVGNLPRPTANAAATLLPDGRGWVTGGRYMETYWSDTWLIGTRMPAPLHVRYDFEDD